MVSPLHLRRNQARLLNRIEIHPVAIASFAFGLLDIVGTAISQIADHQFFTCRTCEANRKNHSCRATIGQRVITDMLRRTPLHYL